MDLDSGKNQAGCFYQPTLVLCDPALLETLPDAEYRAGCAEIIKTAVLFSPELFQQLKTTPIREQFEPVIAACVGMKRDVVQNDEFDRGQRALLNLGHTIGHAVEACSNFTILARARVWPSDWPPSPAPPWKRASAIPPCCRRCWTF